MTPSILVVGDEFRDRYWLGTTTRISPEAPIPVVKIDNMKECWGGAGNVILNLTALGVRVSACGPRYADLPVKNRLCVGNYQLARWDENDTQRETPTRDFTKFGKPDAVIISDYAKGAVTYAVIEAIAALKIPTFIDTKRSPRDFDVVLNPIFFPNQKEYTDHLQDYRVQPFVVLKRGPEGIQFHEFGRVIQDYPALARKVVSVCGAGDTVVAAYTYAYVQCISDPLSFANAAAAVVVEKPDTATATLEEISDMELRTRDACVRHN
jgi:D-beta-D-heptose 7-phosphate kinase / D-beta-D-heptose 1-phosphate adenosyltransferase